jgi:hypothetical protein
MDKIIEDGTSNGHYVSQVWTSVVNDLFAVSVYAKETGVGSKRYLGIITTGFAVNNQAVFDLATGTVTFTGGGATASIIAMGGGIYRCIMYTTAATITGTALQLRLSNVSNAAGPVYLGDSTSSLYMWGVQVEKGGIFGPYTGAYIPTTTATVTLTDFTVNANTITFNTAPASPAVPKVTTAYSYVVQFTEDSLEFNQIWDKGYEQAGITLRTFR